jgi:hypothetical protein
LKLSCALADDCSVTNTSNLSLDKDPTGGNTNSREIQRGYAHFSAILYVCAIDRINITSTSIFYETIHSIHISTHDFVVPLPEQQTEIFFKSLSTSKLTCVTYSET